MSAPLTCTNCGSDLVQRRGDGTFFCICCYASCRPEPLKNVDTYVNVHGAKVRVEKSGPAVQLTIIGPEDPDLEPDPRVEVIERWCNTPTMLTLKADHSIRVEETITPEGSSFTALANDCMFTEGLVTGTGKTAYEAVCQLALNLASKVNELRESV